MKTKKEKEDKILSDTLNKKYEYGFVTNIDQETLPPGLNEDVIRIISQKKEEPGWLLKWRLKAYQQWQKMKNPKWAELKLPEIDYNAISYFSAPKKKTYKSLDEVDPELLRTYEKLGIPIHEQKLLAGVAVDAVFDSVSIATTFKEELAKAGVLIIGIIVLVFLLLGDGSGPYVKSVILNIGELITIVTSETIIGIALLVIAWFVISLMKK